jgi:hypothetical protein
MSLIFVLVGLMSSLGGSAVTAITDDPALLQALDRAGENRAQLLLAIENAPDDEKAGMRFLVTNMPDRDLTSLSADFLLENSALTWKALRESRWKNSVPEDVVFDSLLPYANINERRDSWRKDFFNRFQPLVAEANSPSEAAAILNQKIFPVLNVKYSTGRKKADQSPFESIESGLASCTGLSVLLVDACRAVGVPARIAGTPLWSDKSGNHTWVEIWDNGWHFTGACEPTGNALNQSWFIERALKAQRDDRLHAIYAVTFRRNGQTLPMVWAREVHDVYAVNVTDRYTTLREQVPEGHSVVRLRVVDPLTEQRVSLQIRVLDAAGVTVFEGQSKDDRFDSNDHLTACLKTGLVLKAVLGDRGDMTEFTVSEGEQTVELQVRP